MTIDEIMRAAPVIPVLVLEEEMDWAALAETFVVAGLPVLEVTLRTAVALEAIRQMARVDGAIVGAGTVLTERQLGEAVDAGSRFIVSPGLTDLLGKTVIQSGVAYLPGTANAGDIMRGLDLGLDRFKFFPAEASGGIQRRGEGSTNAPQWPTKVKLFRPRKFWASARRKQELQRNVEP